MKTVQQANLHCHNFFTILSCPAMQGNGDLVTSKGRPNQRSNHLHYEIFYLLNTLLSAAFEILFYNYLRDWKSSMKGAEFSVFSVVSKSLFSSNTRAYNCYDYNHGITTVNGYGHKVVKHIKQLSIIG